MRIGKGALAARAIDVPAQIVPSSSTCPKQASLRLAPLPHDGSLRHRTTATEHRSHLLPRSTYSSGRLQMQVCSLASFDRWYRSGRVERGRSTYSAHVYLPRSLPLPRYSGVAACSAHTALCSSRGQALLWARRGYHHDGCERGADARSLQSRKDDNCNRTTMRLSRSNCKAGLTSSPPDMADQTDSMDRQDKRSQTNRTI